MLANADLYALNTLHLPAQAQWLAQPDSEATLQLLLRDRKYAGLPRTVIGDGSNLVLRADLPGLVIKPSMRGVHLVADSADAVVIDVMAGENWDQLVDYTLRQGWFGLENLSLIPGSVGAAPFQNIGAYGVELSQHLESVNAIALDSGKARRFSGDECRFQYRDSFFKSVEPDRWLISSVRLHLSKRPDPVLDYADLQERFQALPEAQQTPIGLRELVCALRRSKLPDPVELPNAGSFFKNPLVSAAQYHALREQYPELVAFAQTDGRYKLAAGWMIEKAGWKGRREGALGMHARQALVLVNYADADGEQVLAFASRVRQSVFDLFAVWLEQEPVVLPRLQV